MTKRRPSARTVFMSLDGASESISDLGSAATRYSAWFTSYPGTDVLSCRLRVWRNYEGPQLSITVYAKKTRRRWVVLKLRYRRDSGYTEIKRVKLIPNMIQELHKLAAHLRRRTKETDEQYQRDIVRMGNSAR